MKSADEMVRCAVNINTQRLLKTIHKLSEFGSFNGGVNRPTFSRQDIESRHWIARQFEECGLDPVIDGAGNVFGRPRSTSKRLLIGSHSESQINAGRLDGALGVAYAIEIARTFSEDPACRNLPVEPVAWCDEESFFIPFLGSRSFIGDLTEEEIDVAVGNHDGISLRAALKTAGLADRPRRLINPDDYVGYLEAHIEQGDLLETLHKRIGIVTSIVAIWQYRIIFHGQQNHAGTTRMAARKDAGLALAKLAGEIDRCFPERAGTHSVWTAGRISVEPGAQAIIPGKAEMLFQIRDADTAQLEVLEAELRRLVDLARQGPCHVDLKVITKGVPSAMSGTFQAALESAAERTAPGTHIHMPSGASHDAQILARKLPSGMLFVPSIGGVSHHWDENTADEDIVLGCQILAQAARDILQQELGEPVPANKEQFS